MRSFLIVLATAFIAGCATTPAPVALSSTTKVYDQKTNSYRYVAKSNQSEFVGTSASTKAQPGWYTFGHP